MAVYQQQRAGFSSSAFKCLVVGDGNFSFSVLYAGVNKDCEFLSTSLDSEEKVKSTEIGREFLLKAASIANMRVLHEIDAARLQSYPEITSIKFDRVMFNFPHTGGKSNIKRNRELIRDYFHSASKVAHLRGEVWLTLCSGQGGTPGDGSRTYNDSWKVVELAADAGLLLSRIENLSTLLPPGYISTGYRSQSKSFHTDEALVHVFTLFREIERPPTIHHQTISVSCMMHCKGSVVDAPILKLRPEVLPDSMRSFLLNSIHSEPWHPIHTVSSALSEHLAKEFNLLHLHDSWSLHKDRSEKGMLSVSNSDESCCIFGAHISCYQEIIQETTDLYLTPYPPNQNVTIPVSKSSIRDQVVLFPSGECILPNLLSLQSVGRVSESKYTGLQVLSKCARNTCPSLKLSHQPVTHELVCILTIANASSQDSSQSNAADVCFQSTAELLCRLILPGRASGRGHEQIQVESRNEKVKQLVFIPQMSAKDLSNCEYASSFEYLLGERAVTLATCSILKSTDFATTIGLVFKVDSIAVLACHLPDPRLLWSSEERFKSHFYQAHKFTPFVPYSVHSVKYIHDVSFWIRMGERDSLWSECDFFHLIRSICSNVVASVEQIDQHETQDGSVSVCFRIVYFSFDQVLSRSRAYRLQQDLRLAVGEAFSVVLR